MPDVKIANLTKKYGSIIANDNISIEIKNGEYVSVIGPSGCGKTTLIKNITGIITPDEGKIYINGDVVNDLPIEDRKIGYVFQDIALFPHMTVWDNIIYGPKVRGLTPKDIQPLANEMLALIKLEARSDAYSNELSGGTQQKTALARALISQAELLIFDEPLGALDLKVRTKLRYELRRIVKDLKLTALHVTHDQEEAMSISDRVVVMKRGKIVEDGSPVDLYLTPKNLFTANFVGEASFLVGNVIKILADGSLIDLGAGLQLLTKHKTSQLGDRVVIAFRPEFASIPNTLSMNQLHGKVKELQYSGNFIRVKVTLTNNVVVIIRTPSTSWRSNHEVGDDITIRVLPKHLLVYPYPNQGLTKTLALE